MFQSDQGEHREIERASREPPGSRDPDGAALSQRLRLETRPDHQAVERSTGWPDSLIDVAAYRDCLKGLLAIWRPYEAALAAWRDWRDFPVGPLLHRRAHLLERDLRVLGDDPADVADLMISQPATMPALVGTLYVLEGSALGGRIIRADLARRLGADVADATSFFAGAGSEPRAAGASARAPVPWREVLTAIDAFGTVGAGRPDAVVAGARDAFATFLHAFSGRRAPVQP